MPLAAKRYQHSLRRRAQRHHTTPPHNATARPGDGCLHQETVDTIANLATATASDRAAITQLMATVERLMAELFTVNTKLVTALQPQRASWSDRVGQSRGRGAGAGACATKPTHVPPTGKISATRTDNQDLEPPIYYCWTCGPGCRHNSAKCPAPSTGHVYTATKRDM